MSLFKNWTSSAMPDWGKGAERFVEELTNYSRTRTDNPRKRSDLTMLKKSFKEMVRDAEEEMLLDNIKLLKRTVTSNQDLIDVVNTPSMNDIKTVLHKQVREQNVIKVAVLVQLLPCLDIGARDIKGHTVIDYATHQKDKHIRSFLLETYKFRVRRSRGDKKTSIGRSKTALTRMIQEDFRRRDKLKKLRHIIRDAPPSRVRAELRRIERSLCEICDLGAVIDIVKAGKKNARTALQKALDRKDSDRNDVVRMLIRAGASSKYLKDPTNIREANQIARIVLMNSIPSAAPGGKHKGKKSLPNLRPVQPVFGCVLSQLSRTALASAKHGPTRKTSSTLVVPEVVYQCASFLREYGLRTQGVFRIPGDMGIVKRLKNLYNTQSTVDLRIELGANEDSIPKDKLADRCMTVATLLKCFFRELQKPLITVDVMSDLQDIILPVLKNMRKNETETKEVDSKIFSAIQVVLGVMNECNQLCLRYVVRLLADIAVYCEENKMTPKNLSVCWSPSLSFTNEEPEDLMASLQSMANDRFVVEFLIKYADRIFKIRDQACDNDVKDKTTEVGEKMESNDLNILPDPIPVHEEKVDVPSRPKPQTPTNTPQVSRLRHRRTASTVYREIQHSVSSLSCSSQTPRNESESPFSLWGVSEEIAKERRSDAVSNVMESLRVSADGNIEKAHDILKELLTAVEYRLNMLGIKSTADGPYEGDSSEEEGGDKIARTPRLSL